MPAVPEFILRKLYIQDSLQDTLDGLAFALNNTFAPATLKRLPAGSGWDSRFA